MEPAGCSALPPVSGGKISEIVIDLAKATTCLRDHAAHRLPSYGQLNCPSSQFPWAPWIRGIFPDKRHCTGASGMQAFISLPPALLTLSPSSGCTMD